jgi:NTE family protein
MDAPSQAVPKNRHYSDARFEQTVLLLQGGGALGSYQAGVYQALAEANIYPDWVAGISIGAVNSALIAGNPPEKRVERLREFWEAVSTSPLGLPYFSSLAISDDLAHSLLNQTRLHAPASTADAVGSHRC